MIAQIQQIITDGKKSAYLKLNDLDFISSAIRSIFLTTGLTIFASFSSGSFKIGWLSVASITAGTFGNFLLTNLFSGKKVEQMAIFMNSQFLT